MKIYEATRADTYDLLSIEKKCFKAHQFTKTQFQYYLNQDSCISFAISDNDACGYILGIVDHRGKEKKALIYSLAILPGYRNKGYATLLMQRFEREAAKRGCKQVLLVVGKSNTKAFELYIKLGYKVRDVRKDYYGKGQHGLNMFRILN
jgi:ribosomal protein S18 acetylase RimI-like enzyme